MEPKRRALKEANDELLNAHKKLASVEAKVMFYLSYQKSFLPNLTIANSKQTKITI